MEPWQAIEAILVKYSLVTAFALVAGVMWLSYQLSTRVMKGRIHGSAIAIFIGLLLAFFAGHLQAWCKDKLSSYKLPRHLLCIHELPRNAMGKVTKPDLIPMFS